MDRFTPTSSSSVGGAGAAVPLSLLAVAAYRMGCTTIILVALGILGRGAAVVAVLDRPGWATGGRQAVEVLRRWRR